MLDLSKYVSNKVAEVNPEPSSDSWGDWVSKQYGNIKAEPLNLKYTIPAGLALGAFSGLLGRKGSTYKAIRNALVGGGLGAALSWGSGPAKDFTGLWENTKNLPTKLFGKKQAEYILSLYEEK